MANWQQAQQLMQPAFIRLIANIQKQLDQSVWRGSYEDAPTWPEGVDDDVKLRVMQLQERLKSATLPGEIAEIEQTLADLPAPVPGYLLRLSHQDRQVTIDLWEMCYRICFRDYDATSGTSRSRGFGQPSPQTVEVDASLIDPSGEVDWHCLDDKTRRLVEQVFAKLSG